MNNKALKCLCRNIFSVLNDEQLKIVLDALIDELAIRRARGKGYNVSINFNLKANVDNLEKGIEESLKLANSRSGRR